MTFSFSNRPATVEPTHLIAGERPAKVYDIGRHRVTVYDDGAVTCEQPCRTSSYDTLPNMEIVDGQIRIAMEDLIDEILARIEPEELAVSLWVNDAVKERFMEALSERWSYSNVSDADRRKFLELVKETIHDVALDKLASAMATMEYKHATLFSAWQSIRDCNETLRALNIRHQDGDIVQLVDPTQNTEFKIGGTAWNEARDHWRAEVRERFGITQGAAS